MSATEFRRLQVSVMLHLQARCGTGATNLSEMREVFAELTPDLLEKALQGLRASGLLTYLELCGPDGVECIELTSAGLGWQPARVPVQRGITINGGNVQIGSFNRQDVRVSRRFR